MKTLYRKISATILAVLFLATSCDNFDALENPNEPTVPIMSSMLTGAILSIGGTVTSTTGVHYVQHLANTQYTDDDNYQTVKFSFNGYYQTPMANLKTIIDYNTNPETAELASAYGSNENQIAVANILLSYYFLHMTDRWGDIPYFEALKARSSESILQPKYDTQEAIYDDIFVTLADAVSKISNADAVQGDILFEGDMGMWKKFANTLRMNAALRLSKVNPSKGSAEFNAALNAGIISTDNLENITYPYLDNQDNENPWFSRFRTREDYAVSDVVVNFMNISSAGGTMDVEMDPRLPLFANATESSNYTEYVGMPYGLTQADAGSINNSDISLLGDAMRIQNADVPVFTAAQVLFSLAEARELGWITTGTTQQYYEDGIAASMDQFGATIGSYMTNSEVAFDPARALEQIGTQKWLALYLNGYEAWAEWRRTGFPQLAPAGAAQTPNGEIPTRQAYPSSERDLNSTNWETAVAAIPGGSGQDDLTGKVWWDK